MNTKPLIIGVLNVTPDSFSDGDKHNSVNKALNHALRLEKEGADIIDIGGESTGPNSKYVSLDDELQRVIPVIKLIRKKTKIPISIDTYKAVVAEKALLLGANMINDVTALRGDPNMAKIVAKYKCPVILMYSKDKTPRTTTKNINYKDIIAIIKNFFRKQITFAKKHGIKPSQIIIDPGMGQFISAIPKYSFEILMRLKELKKMKYKICIGASRKSFLGEGMETRDEKTKIVNAIAYLNGASIIRTHDVAGTIEILKKLKKCQNLN